MSMLHYIPHDVLEAESDQAARLVAACFSRGEAAPLYAILIMFGAQQVLERRLRRRRHRTARLGLSIAPIEKRRSPMDPVNVDGRTHDVQCQCSPADANGSPTTPTIAWASSNEAVVRLEVAPDTRSARGITLSDGTAIISAHTGTLGGDPVVLEEGTVVVSGIGTPPPPPLPTATLGLSIAPVEKVPA